MIVFFVFFFGFFFSFVGSITPSMLNMTALKISLENGSKQINKYALGVSLVVFPQAYVAILLTKYIAENASILEMVQKIGAVIFIFLSFYFYRESKKVKIQTTKVKNNNPFLTGITLSALNMFGIPFFGGIVATLNSFNLFSFHLISILFFILGSVLGTFYILFLYGKFAKIIQKKTGKLTKDINIILAILTALVAIITFIKLFI
jgi:threonine/homoserine/homoserine lactone efflux protein